VRSSSSDSSALNSGMFGGLDLARALTTELRAAKAPVVSEPLSPFKPTGARRLVR